MTIHEESDALRNMVDSEVECILAAVSEVKNAFPVNIDSDTIELGLRLDLTKTLLALACADDSFTLTNGKVNEVEYITGLPSQSVDKVATYICALDPQNFVDDISEMSPVVPTYVVVDSLMGITKSDARYFPEFFKLNYLAGQHIISFSAHSVLRQRQLLSARLTALVSYYSQESIAYVGGFIK